MYRKSITLLTFCILASLQQTAIAKTSFYAPEVKKKVSVETKKKTKYSLGGQLTLKDRVHDSKVSFSASATWKPDSKDYWYIKGTAKHNFDNGDEGFTYNYGLGYDDWHEGTWTVQINNYDSLKIGKGGFNLDSAIVSVGYKTKIKQLQKLNMKSTITLSKRTDGDTKLSTSLQWAPKKYWFIKGILITPLENGKPYWNYLFGYDDWHPGTFGFEYTNYESNPTSETNFRKGFFSLTYKYKLK